MKLEVRDSDLQSAAQRLVQWKKTQDLVVVVKIIIIAAGIIRNLIRYRPFFDSSKEER